MCDRTAISPGETWRLEQFSKAYVQAIASAVGCKFEQSTVDDESVDVTLRKRPRRPAERSIGLDIQLKATTRDCISGEEVRFPLPIKNYDELRTENVMIPRILVLVLVPDVVREWTEHDESRLALRRCGYWTSLRGLQGIANTSTKTISIPRRQVFDTDALTRIVQRLSADELP